MTGKPTMNPRLQRINVSVKVRLNKEKQKSVNETVLTV